MNPKQISEVLVRIANSIDASKSPDRARVAADLKKVLAALNRTAAWDWDGISKAFEGAQKSWAGIGEAIKGKKAQELEKHVGSVKSTIDQLMSASDDVG